VSEIALEAWRLKVNGLNYREIADSLNIQGTSKQDRHNKPADLETLSAEDPAREFVKLDVKREFLAEVIQKM